MAIFWPFQLVAKSLSTSSPLAGIRLFHCGFWRNLTKFTFLATRRTKGEMTTKFSSLSEQLATQLLLSMILWSNALNFTCNFYFSVPTCELICSPKTLCNIHSSLLAMLFYENGRATDELYLVLLPLWCYFYSNKCNFKQFIRFRNLDHYNLSVVFWLL